MSRKHITGHVVGQRDAALAQARDLTTRSLHLRVDTLDVDGRSVEAIMSTETPVQVFDFERFVIIDEVLRADGAELPDQVVLLETHARFSLDDVLGSVRDMRVEGGNTVGRLVFAEGDDKSDRSFSKVRQGHITDVSVGYRAIEFQDLKPNETRTVNGREYKAGDRSLRVTTRWSLRELSLVPIGADDGAKVRDEKQRGPNTMRKQLHEYLQILGLRSEATDAEAWAFFNGLGGEKRTVAENIKAEKIDVAPEPARTTPPPQPARSAIDPPVIDPPAVPVDDVAIRAEGQRMERERCAAIREMAGDAVAADLVERAINEGWTAERAAPLFLEAVRDRAPGVIVRTHDRDCNAETLAVGMLHRAGLPLFDQYGRLAPQARQDQMAEQGYQYRDMSMIDLFREAARIDGPAPGQSTPHTRQEFIRAAVSGGTLSGIFTTIVNAQLMQSFAEDGDSTSGWTSETDVADFKNNERTRVTASSGLKKLAAGGKAQHASRGDQTEGYKIARYANDFVVDEQDIINDRFNALLQEPQRMGMAAARLRPDLVYSILLANAALDADSVALFDASTHANLVTTAFSAAALQVAIAAVAKQTETVKGDVINLNIATEHIVVPQDLVFAVQIALKSAERVIASASGGTFNPLNALNIEIHADNRIGAAGVTDPDTGTVYTGTATNWFTSASASRAPTIEVGYLQGTGRRPQLRTYILDKGQWGFGADINMDIGAKALDFRGLYKSTGAG